MWCKQTDLQKIFSLGSTFTTKVCRLIDANMERYGDYAVVGKRYSVFAFADAYKHHEELTDGEELPPFDIEKVKSYLFDRYDEDARDFYKVGERKTRLAIANGVERYFKETPMPPEVRSVRRAIRTAVLTIIHTEKIDEL